MPPMRYLLFWLLPVFFLHGPAYALKDPVKPKVICDKTGYVDRTILLQYLLVGEEVGMTPDQAIPYFNNDRLLRQLPVDDQRKLNVVRAQIQAMLESRYDSYKPSSPGATADDFLKANATTVIACLN